MSNYSNEVHLLADQALALRFDNRKEAFELLDKAVNLDGSFEGVAEGIKGTTLWSGELREEALLHLERAVELRPIARGASVALFHIFLELVRINEAIAEGTRFFKAFDSSDHLPNKKVERYREFFRSIASRFEENPEALYEELKEEYHP